MTEIHHGPDAVRSQVTGLPTPATQPSRPTFEEMLQEELPGLRLRCRSLTRNSADAEDLMQEVLLRAYRAYGRFDGRYPKAWLYTIARNTNVSLAQAQRMSHPCDPTVLIETESADHDRELSSERLMRAALAAELIDAIDSLEPLFKEVALLVFVEKKTVRDAAAALNVPYGTILSRLYRTRQRLRIILQTRQAIEEART